MDLYQQLMNAAREEGFPLAGALDFELAWTGPSSIQNHIEHFDTWLTSGYAGAMEYLARGRDRRANPQLLFPEAKSILCVAISYPRNPAGTLSPEQGPRYARYLQGRDYHHEIAEKLERTMEKVKSRWTPPSEVPLKWKICVDTSAVLERSWAALAGLGWIGKNTLLIHPKLGSYLFLGEVLINYETGKGPSPLPNYCGHCTRCLTACPTQAFQKPHLLNSNRCISYWSLEKRGDLNLDPSSQNRIGSWIAGCDICQEACPFNLKPSQLEMAQVANQNSIPENATQLSTWKALLLETPEEYKQRVKNSAMKRVKPAQFSRNLAITLGNSLASLLQTHPEEALSLEPLIRFRIDIESDEAARRKWIECLDHFPNRNP